MKPLYEKLGPSWAMYTMDHRGTGRSARLDCQPRQVESRASEGGTDITGNESVQCSDVLRSRNRGKIGNLTYAFTVDEAASDLAGVIALTRGSAAVHVYGVSYGTTLVHRYAQMFVASQHPSSITLDGITCSEGPRGERNTFGYWDVMQHRIGIELLRRCREDGTFCRAKVGMRAGEDPESFIRSRIFPKVLSGECDIGTRDLRFVKGMLGMLLPSANTRSMIFALLTRINRCSASDAAVLRQFVAMIVSAAAQDGTCVAGDSTLLYNNIASTEIWDIDPRTTVQELEGYVDAAIMCSPENISDLVRVFDAWPSYPLGPYFNKTGKSVSQ